MLSQSLLKTNAESKKSNGTINKSYLTARKKTGKLFKQNTKKLLQYHKNTAGWTI